MAIEKKVKITVISSKCDHYKVGDEIYMDGAFIDKEKTKVDICVTALHALYNFIYAARKGLSGDDLGFPDMVFQCPDIPESVEFKIEAFD